MSVYIFREREHKRMCEEVYKIGMTKRDTLSRLKEYPKDTQIFFCTLVEEPKKIENLIIKSFLKKFKQRTDIGKEYFEGNIKGMIKDVLDIINDNTFDDLDYFYKVFMPIENNYKFFKYINVQEMGVINYAHDPYSYIPLKDYDNIVKNINKVTFETENERERNTETISFNGYVTLKFAIETVEKYLSEPMTEEFFRKNIQSYESIYNIKDFNCKGQILGSKIFIEKIFINNGELTFFCGS